MSNPTTREALLDALVIPAGGTSHLITLTSVTRTGSTSVTSSPTGWDIEHPQVIDMLADCLREGETAGLIMRTFEPEIAFFAPNGTPIPWKTVRSWTVTAGTLVPRTEAETFSAFCTDAATGEPIAPDGGVRYADAWAVPS